MDLAKISYHETTKHLDRVYSISIANPTNSSGDSRAASGLLAQ